MVQENLINNKLSHYKFAHSIISMPKINLENGQEDLENNAM